MEQKINSIFAPYFWFFTEDRRSKIYNKEQ